MRLSPTSSSLFPYSFAPLDVLMHPSCPPDSRAGSFSSCVRLSRARPPRGLGDGGQQHSGPDVGPSLPPQTTAGAGCLITAFCCELPSSPSWNPGLPCAALTAVAVVPAGRPARLICPQLGRLLHVCSKRGFLPSELSPILHL